MRWCSWWSRASPSKRTWRGRLPDRCALCGGTKSAMRRAGWRRSVARKGWRRGRRRISGKRLRSIEMLKSQGMSNRAIAHRLGVSEKAIRKLVGPSKPHRERAACVRRDHDRGGEAAGDWRAVCNVERRRCGSRHAIGEGPRRRPRSDHRACGTTARPVPMSLDRDASDRTLRSAARLSGAAR